MPFDELYYLAENFAHRYYTSVIKTFIGITKCSITERHIVLVNMARALNYLEDFDQRQSVIYGLGKISSSPRQFRELAVAVWILETSHF